MIWHIVKKDWKLLWPWALLLAVFELGRVILLILQPIKNLEHYGSDPATDSLATILWGAVLIAGALLIARLSHQDAIPGVRQDWLVRPISRRQLLGAKVLGLILFVHVPLFGIDVFYNLMGGFPILSIVTTALAHGFFVFAAISLPVLALCATSRNLGEAVASGLILVLTIMVFATVAQAFHWQLFTIFRTSVDTPLKWIPEITGYLVLFIGAIAVLSTQYFRRATLFSRLLVCAAWAMFGLAVSFFPWKAAFAIQSQLAEQKGLGSPVTLSFDASIGRYRRPQSRVYETDSKLYIPIQIQGLPPNTALKSEFWDSHAITASGRTIHVSRDTQQDFMANGPAHLKIGLEPITGFAPDNARNNPETKDKPFQLEIELSMTLLKSDELTSLPSVWGPRSLTNRPCRMTSTTVSGAFGEDFVDPRDLDVEFICAPVVPKAPCVSMVLIDLPSPWVQRASLSCFRTYSPLPHQVLSGGDGAIAHAYFYDPARNEEFFGTEGDKLANTKLDLHWYKPVDHFTRKIVIPNVRLNDWISETP